MAKRPLPDPETLRKLLRYDPETGKLYWRERTPGMFSPFSLNGPAVACETWNAENAGNPALNYEDSRGYLAGTLLGRTVRAHRVIWAISHGQWPSVHVDHTNGKRTDNRLSNLRLASNAQNGSNRTAQKNNACGYKGVRWHKGQRSWLAAIQVDGRSIHLGSFKTPEQAHNAYKEAALKYFGEFARY